MDIMQAYVDHLNETALTIPCIQDTEYQAYLDATWGNQDYTMEYQEWQEFRNMHDIAVRGYDAFVSRNNLYSGRWQPILEKQAERKMQAMIHNEWVLRY